MNRSFGLIVSVAVITLMATILSAVAADTVTITIPDKQQQAVQVFWTLDKIAKAKPFPMPVDYGQSGVDPDAAALEEEIFNEPAVSSPAAKAESSAGRIAQARVNDYSESDPLDEDLLADIEAGTTQTFTSYNVNNKSALWNVYPHKWVGRLSFTTPSGTSYCSATVIKNNTIVTAAHCVYDTGTRNAFYTNWIFTPAYKNGSAPFGSFTWSSATVLTAWINLSGSFSINGWTKYDVAVIKLNANTLGTVNGLVGNAGYTYGAAYNQLVFNSGYPWKNYNNVTLPSAGAFLRACTAETFTQTTDTLGGGCDFGPGISGGSWLLSYKPIEVSGYVNSVNSGLYIGTKNLYGARFSSNNFYKVCLAAGCL